MPAVEPVTSAVFPERSIFMCHLHPKRFRAKHALGLDPGVDTGSREENASKQNLMLMEILGSNAAAAIGAGSIPG
jgi:hypothetical protein